MENSLASAVRPLQQGLSALQEGLPVQHDQAAAGVAAHFDIGAGPGDRPLASSAGVGLPGLDDISDQNGIRHRRSRPFWAAVYAKASQKTMGRDGQPGEKPESRCSQNAFSCWRKT